MSDTTNPPTDPAERPRPADSDRARGAEPPKDVPTAQATGYAVYDTTIGQYVGQVKHGKEKPTDEEVAGVLAEGHGHAIVRV